MTVLISPLFIPFLRRLKFGQSIRDEGPKSHMKKTGTPTMGGIMIIFSTIVTATIMVNKTSVNGLGYEFWLLIFVMGGYGLIGFLDDFIKVAMKRNLGLTSKQKMLGQLLIAFVFFAILRAYDFPTYIQFPGTHIQWDLDWGYAFLIAFGAFGILAWYSHPQLEVTIFALAVVGSLLGFLVFNAHPAKVFMGDTGSLALGAAIAAIAILTKLEIILVIIGGVFVIETLS